MGMQHLKGKFRKATSTRRGRIIAVSILVFILAAVAGGVIYWKIYRKQIIRNELEKVVKNKSKGLYQLTYDSLKLDEVAGNLAIQNVRLVYDSNHYSRLLQRNDAPATLVKISIPAISVMGVQTPRALLSKEIVGKKLTISRPVIDIIYTGEGKDSARYVPTRDVYQQLLGELGMVKIDTLEIIGAEIATSKLKQRDKLVRFSNTSLRLVNVAIDEETRANPKQVLFADHLFLEAEKVSFRSEVRPYDFSIDSISLNSGSRSGFVKQFRIDPRLGEDAFVKSLPFQDDRFDFSLTNITLKSLDIRQLFNENIVADSLVIGNAVFKIYRDLAIPRDKKNRVGRYPHQLLDKLPVSVEAKRLILSNAYVEYKEKSKITRQSGRVRFHRVYASFENVTNDKEIKANNIMTANINTRFLDKAPLKVEWKFYLGHPRGRFDLKGRLGAIAAADVNPLTVPMGPARLKEGQVKSLDFDLEGSDYSANGNVRMIYNDLKLSLLEKEPGSGELDNKTLASFVANIVVKNDNPNGKSEEPRVANVQLDRDTNRSIFYLAWKSIFKGIRETVGIKK